MKLTIAMWVLVFTSYSLTAQSYHFKSGFERTTVLRQYELNGKSNQKYADLYGMDQITGYDWQRDLDDNQRIGNFRIYYEFGDTTKSKASIVPDPVNHGNRVLKFQLNAPNVPNSGKPKGRVQAAINGNKNLKAFAFRIRLFISPDIDLFRQYAKDISWFTLMEFWNNEANKDFPFRITLNIQKPDEEVGSPLYFGAHGQTRISKGKWQNVWAEVNRGYPLPVGEWLLFESYFQEGDALSGRYKVTVTDARGVKHLLFDISDYTHHPDDPHPDGVTAFNPMKLYTSGVLIDRLANANAELSVFWDDFEFWTDSIPVGVNNASDMDIRISPNPCRAALKIQGHSNVKSFCIYDMNGHVIRQFVGALPHYIDTKDLCPGMYYIQITSHAQTLSTHKFLKL